MFLREGNKRACRDEDDDEEEDDDDDESEEGEKGEEEEEEEEEITMNHRRIPWPRNQLLRPRLQV